MRPASGERDWRNDITKAVPDRSNGETAVIARIRSPKTGVFCGSVANHCFTMRRRSNGRPMLILTAE